MSDFAALLESAKFEPKKVTPSEYTGPIDDAVVKLVDMLIANGERATIPVDGQETFDKYAVQIAAQARTRGKTAAIGKGFADKEKTELVSMRVSVGDKRGRKENSTEDAPPAE